MQCRPARPREEPSSIPTALSLSGRTFGEVCERYLDDPTIGQSAKSQIGYRATFMTIVLIIGRDTALSSIWRDTCRHVLGVLQRLPPNYRKHWPGQSAISVADEARPSALGARR